MTNFISFLSVSVSTAPLRSATRYSVAFLYPFCNVIRYTILDYTRMYASSGEIMKTHRFVWTRTVPDHLWPRCYWPPLALPPSLRCAPCEIQFLRAQSAGSIRHFVLFRCENCDYALGARRSPSLARCRTDERCIRFRLLRARSGHGKEATGVSSVFLFYPIIHSENSITSLSWFLWIDLDDEIQNSRLITESWIYSMIFKIVWGEIMDNYGNKNAISVYRFFFLQQRCIVTMWNTIFDSYEISWLKSRLKIRIRNNEETKNKNTTLKNFIYSSFKLLIQKETEWFE